MNIKNISQKHNTNKRRGSSGGTHHLGGGGTEVGGWKRQGRQAGGREG